MVNLKLMDTGELLTIEDLPFPVELNSTAFGDVIPGSRVYEVKLPVEPNEKQLQESNYIEVAENIQAYDVELQQEGVPKLMGKLNIQKFDNRFFYGSITVNPFAQDIGSKSLRDMPWPGDFFLGNNADQVRTAAKTESQKFYPDANFAFPSFYAPDFYGNRPGNWGGVVNAFEGGTVTYFKNTILGGGEHNDNIYALCPMLYLRYILKIVFEENGYELKGTWITDDIMKHTLWFYNYALDRVPNETYYAQAFNNDQIRLDSNITDDLRTLSFPVIGSDTQSCFSLSSGNDPITQLPFSMTTYEAKQNGVHVFKIDFNSIAWTSSPDDYEEGTLTDEINFTLRNLTTSTDVDTYQWFNPEPCRHADNVKISLSGNATTGDLFAVKVERRVKYSSKNILGNITAQDFERDITFYGGATYTVRNAQYSSLNIYDTKVHYANHVQNIKVGKWLLELRDFFGLHFTFNYKRKLVTIDWLQDILPKTPKQLNGPYAKNYKASRDTDTGFTLKYDMNENDEAIPSPDDHNYLGEYNGGFEAPAPKMGDMIYESLYNTYALTRLNTSNTVEWYKKAWNYPPLILGDGSREKQLSISPLVMTNAVMDSKNFLMPYFKDQGSSSAFEIGVNEPKMKVVYFFGMRTPAEGSTYPFATSLEKYPNYTRHTLPRLTLDYHDRSIFMMKLKNWYDFLLNTIEVERQLLITDQEIEEYDFSEPELIDGVVYIRKQLLYEIANQWPNRAKVTLLRLWQGS